MIPLLDIDLSGRTALVTGAARRVGAEIARALAAAQARVAVHYRSSASEADSLVRELATSGAGARAFPADLADPGAIAGLFRELSETGYVPDIVINSASNFEPTSVEGPDLAGWNDTLAVNLTAPYLVAMHAVERWGEGEGDIVNIADVWGERPMRGYIAYTVSKAGLLMLTRSLAKALGPGVRVNAVAPGPVLLPEDYDATQRHKAVARTLLRREGSARDVANAVLFLLGGTDFATGSVITVDGGRQVL